MATKRKTAQRAPEQTSRELLLPREVWARTRLSETTIARLEKRGLFPKRVTIGFKRIAWRASDIDAWIAAGGTSAFREPAAA